MATWRNLTFPSKAFVAASASGGFLKVTKAKPLAIPVLFLRMILTEKKWHKKLEELSENHLANGRVINSL